MAPTVSVVFILCCGLLLLLMATTGSTGGHVEAASSTRLEQNSTETFRRIARDRRRYCGKVLTDTLAMVCTSYPSPWRKKSMEPTSPDDEDSSAEGSYREQLLAEIKQDLDELEQLSPEMFAEKPPHSSGQFHPFYPRSVGQGHRRVRRQIVDECCRKSCTLKTLKQYCAD